MSRINSNVPSLVAQRHLTVSQQALGLSLERLSSGLRINRGADDPAGLIVSERLRSEIAAIDQAVKNSSRAINVIATTEGALNEVAALLTDIQALVVEAANKGAFSDEEIKANQLQIDASIDSITRIANTTNFAGRKLINGELDYITSGVTRTELANVHINGAKFGSRAYIPVTVNVSLSAQQAEVRYTQSTVGANGATIDVGGPDGIITLSFPANASSNDIVDAINAQTDDTGVYAALIGTSGVGGVAIRSQEYGSNAFVGVKEMSTAGSFAVIDRSGGSIVRTAGRDAQASINGVSTTADGLRLSLSTTNLKADVTLAEDFGNGSVHDGTTTMVGTSTYAITEGGALFQLGPQVNTNLQDNIGVQSMQANKLGNALVGYLSDLKDGQQYGLRTSNFKQASDVVNEVITQVSFLRGRLGAFERDTLQPNIAQLQITSENLRSSQSVIRDTDFATETSELTRAQILVQAGNSILAIANAQSQNVLQLLGG
ncbi:MAG: flagellin [Planctomycetes bacterium]|nr:flagellin [Planctomycetota bacterium]